MKKDKVLGVGTVLGEPITQNMVHDWVDRAEKSTAGDWEPLFDKKEDGKFDYESFRERVGGVVYA
ncbi:hypothetical protein FACS1894125_1660 [Actinomycetota bacterium]|nr:hypothetical protein FACS1894125_1660 [Actinomycetota bacterium]